MGANISALCREYGISRQTGHKWLRRFRAQGYTGLVEAYRHICRRKGCTEGVEAPDSETRRCSVHGAKLWPKPKVRPIRFHDLRHTTASLLLQAGAPLHAVQRILRHRDPRMTANVYGHLSTDYLRAEIDRLRFNPESTLGDGETERRVPLMSPSPESGAQARERLPRNVPPAFMVSRARSTGLEPVTSGVTGRRSNQLN